jgi:long-chain acyl-CoA synthetase
VGRTDDIIARGGFKVDLNRIEKVLLSHPGVTGACAVDLPDERLGQVPAALVTLADAASTLGDVADLLRDRLRHTPSPS